MESGRRRSCPCSRARPPAGSGQRQLSTGWRRNPGRFSASQLRTLQRRLQDWRALNGPDQEVYFPQEHPPGREAQLDFTHCNSLGVTIGGRPYRHLLFQLVLSHSGWRYAEVATGETFLALKQGLQNALWELGGAPRVIRSDNTSAATHEMRRSRGRALNDSYAELLEHYGLESTRINSGESHENGVAEQAHFRLKDAIDQALMLRGSRDFSSLDEYTCFIKKVVDRRNRLVQEKLEQERPHLQLLPPAPVPEYVNHRARVRKWSTIQAAGRTYTVPSRLIGQEVQIRLYAGHLEVYYKGHLVERMERVRGEREARVDYRHVIGSLVRKPGAFARYRFREQMFPTLTFRLAYDALREWRRRARRRGVRAHPALGSDDHGVHGGQRPGPAAGGGRTLRLRRGQGAGQAHAVAGAGTQPARSTGPEGLRLPAGGGGLMTDTVAIQDRIGELCHQFRLPTMGAQSVARFTAAGHGHALETLLEVLEQEAEDRRQRRISRLRTASRLPAGKTWETFEHDRVPLALRQQLDDWPAELRGPGRQRAGLRAARHRQDPRPVRRGPPAGGVGTLGALRPGLPAGAGPPGRQARPRPCRDNLRRLDSYDFLLLDDLGYLPQGAEESEVLFTLIAERYERRSLGITSNLVFSQWEHIFANPMATAAAIDRVVHHSVILEFDVPSYRTGVAQQRGQDKEVNRQE